jgi:hypothetical protein
MFVHPTQWFRRHGHLRKWVVGAAVIALAAWLFEFSSHFHLADADDTTAPTAAHVCGYCAAMQVGVGAASVTFHIAPAAPEHVEIEAAPGFVTSDAPASYRSRAPPIA